MPDRFPPELREEAARVAEILGEEARTMGGPVKYVEHAMLGPGFAVAYTHDSEHVGLGTLRSWRCIVIGEDSRFSGILKSEWIN